MKLQHLLSLWVLLFLLNACRRELSCEDCPSIQTNTIMDSLPASYSFQNGYCAGSFLGISIPFHDSVRYSGKDSLVDSLQLDMPVPGDQQTQGSCSAWATVYAAGSYKAHISSGKSYSDSSLLSPKFTYNQITKGNCGCTSITDNLYLLQTQGASSLKDMPYNPNECLLQPDSLQRKKAEPFKIKDWLTVDLTNLALIKEQLSQKMPVIFSTNSDNGLCKLQAPFIWKQRTGDANGHALVICGYDDKRKAFRIINSWSTRWADKGFAWIDYTFFVKNLKDPLGYVITL